MKLQFLISDFKKALNRLAVLPGAKLTDEISDTLWMEAGLDGLTLNRTSGVAKIGTICDSIIQEEGEYQVSFDRAQKLVATLPGTELVQVSTSEKTQSLTIAAKSSRGTLKAVKVNPPIHTPGAGESKVFLIPAGIFRNGIAKALPAAAQPIQSKPGLEGIVCRSSGEKLMICGTDGRRLHIFYYDIENVELDCLIPTGVASAIKSLLGDEKEETILKVLFNESRIAIKGEKSQFVFALSEHIPPNFSGFIDRPTKPVLLCNRKDLIAAATSASAYNSHVKITVHASGAVVSAVDNIGQEFVHDISSERSVPSTILVNWDYLVDFLEIFEEEQILIEKDEMIIAASEPGRKGILCKIRVQPTPPTTK